MSASSLAGIITAVATVVSAAGGLFLALAVFLPIMRETRVAARASVATLDEVHTIVNQQRTDMTNFNRALIRALNDAGVPVPIDQSVAPVVDKPSGAPLE